MKHLVASPKTRHLAVEALQRSAQNRPTQSQMGTPNKGEMRLSRGDWYDYSHDLIASIQKLERGN